MKTKVIIFSTIIFAFFITSCQKEVQETNIRFNNVDPDLWPYYAAFENEAAKRGLSYDLNLLRVSGKIDEIDQANVAGSCRFGSHIDNAVTIDESFWNRSSTTMKEFVVFHELGHCVLLRGHDESSDNQGRCLSIMRSGLNGCRDSYNVQNRSWFIDELFFQD